MCSNCTIYVDNDVTRLVCELNIVVIFINVFGQLKVFSYGFKVIRIQNGFFVGDVRNFLNKHVH